MHLWLWWLWHRCGILCSRLRIRLCWPLWLRRCLHLICRWLYLILRMHIRWWYAFFGLISATGCTPTTSLIFILRFTRLRFLIIAPLRWDPRRLLWCIWLWSPLGRDLLCWLSWRWLSSPLSWNLVWELGRLWLSSPLERCLNSCLGAHCLVLFLITLALLYRFIRARNRRSSVFRGACFCVIPAHFVPRIRALRWSFRLLAPLTVLNWLRRDTFCFLLVIT